MHLQSIEDKFSPHDAVFLFATPAELKEQSLHSEISLHTAASIKSTSESHLSGITEDEDTRSEATQKPLEHGTNAGSEVSPPAGDDDDDVQARHDKVNEIISAMRNHERSSSNPEGMRPRTTSDTNKALPPTPEGVRQDYPKPVSKYNSDSRPSISTVDSRMSTQSARPSTRDLSHAYEYKPKVKLGPRPSTDSASRQDTLGGTTPFRPISTLPAGLRMPTRKNVPARPRSQQTTSNFSSAPPNIPLPPPPPITPNHATAKTSVPYADRQTASIKSTDQSSVKMTPEKKRLMKALQLRQKQQSLKTHVIDEAKPREAVGAPEPVSSRLGMDTPKKEISEEPAKLDSLALDITQARMDGARAPATPPQSHVDSPHEIQTTVQDSPISEPQPFDGHSTQPSSVSEDDISSTKPSHYSDETVTEENKNVKPPEKDAIDEDPSSNEEIEHSKSMSSQILREDSDASSSSSSELVEVPIMMTENPLDSHTLNRTSHKRQESSTMEFGGDGQESGTSEQVHHPVEAVNHVRDEQCEPARPPIEGSDSNEQAININFLADNPMYLEGRDTIQVGKASVADYGSSDSGIKRLSKALSKQVSDQNLPSNLGGAEIHSSVDVHNVDQTVSTATIERTDLSSGGSPTEQGDGRKASVLGLPQARSESGDHLNTIEGPLRAQSGHASPGDVQSSGELLSAQRISETPGTNDSAMEPSVDGTIKRAFRNGSEGQRPEATISRQGLASPTERASSIDQTEEQFLSDDSFMEELKTAAVQEAKPMSVSKSPIRPVFSRNGTEQRPLERLQTLRSFSGPGGDGIKRDLSPSPQATASPASARSFSASSSPFLNQPSAFAAPPKKIGVSTSISQRIKALEQLSSRPTSPTLQSPPQATFISLHDRKTSLGPASRPKIAKTQDPPATADGTTFSVNSSRLNRNPQSPTTSPNTPNKINADSMDRFSRARPESVSVTATIVRDPIDTSRNARPSETNAMDLHQSPLVIERQSMGPPPLPPLQPPRPRYARQASARSGSSSGAEMKKEASPRASRRDSFVSWRSLSSRNGSDLDLPRSTSDNSLTGTVGLDSVKEEKKDSKRSRLLKRVSSISSMSRRSIATALSPGPKEASILEHQEPIASTTPLTLDLGDVQVQFPDTLLWKPRHMMVDEHGSLVISPSSSDKNTKVLTKRFPLTNFRPPYVPDQDRQELANSKSFLVEYSSGRANADNHPQVSSSTSRMAALCNALARPRRVRRACSVLCGPRILYISTANDSLSCFLIYPHTSSFLFVIVRSKSVAFRMRPRMRWIPRRGWSLVLVNIRKLRDEDGVGFRLSEGIPKWAIHNVHIRLGWLV